MKPWDDETDMKALEESVRSIEKDGLLWGASQLVPIGKCPSPSVLLDAGHTKRWLQSEL